jgi:hypothetical protein
MSGVVGIKNGLKSEPWTNQSPSSLTGFFAGASNIIFTFGGHAMLMEVTAHSSWSIGFRMLFLPSKGFTHTGKQLVESKLWSALAGHGCHVPSVQVPQGVLLQLYLRLYARHPQLGLRILGLSTRGCQIRYVEAYALLDHPSQHGPNLPTGVYQLLAGARLANGEQFAHCVIKRLRLKSRTVLEASLIDGSVVYFFFYSYEGFLYEEQTPIHE